MSNGTVVKGDAGITQKQLDDMVVILETVYAGLSTGMKNNFDNNVQTTQVKVNGTAISHSGTTLNVGADKSAMDIGSWIVSNSVVMQLMNDFRLASTANDVVRFYLDT